MVVYQQEQEQEQVQVIVHKALPQPFGRFDYIYYCPCGAYAIGGMMAHHLTTEHKWSDARAETIMRKAKRVFKAARQEG